MLDRMIGAARLDIRVYEEVEADTAATPQTMTVVVLVAAATGIGAIAAGGLSGLIFGIIFGLISWAFWAYLTHVIGTTLFRTPETEANWGQLARTTGFAQTPGLFRIFGSIPGIGSTIYFAASLWQLVAMVIAVRQALDYRSTWRALGVVLVGFIVVATVQGIMFALLSS